MPHAIGDEVLDGDELEVVLGAEDLELRATHHRAVLGEDLADDAGGVQPGKAGEVGRRFCLAGAHEHAAVTHPQGEGVAGAHEVAGLRVGIEQRLDGRRTVVRRDAGRRASFGLDRHREGGLEARCVLGHHHRDAQLLEPAADERHADETASVFGHEVDGFGRDHLGGHGEVAFVLAILVIHDDDHLSGADVGDGFFDCGERHLSTSGCFAGPGGVGAIPQLRGDIAGDGIGFYVYGGAHAFPPQGCAF